MGLWLLRAQDVNVPQQMKARSKEVILEQKINMPLSPWLRFNIKLIISLCCHNSISRHMDILHFHNDDEKSA